MLINYKMIITHLTKIQNFIMLMKTLFFKKTIRHKIATEVGRTKHDEEWEYPNIYFNTSISNFIYQ